LEDNILAGKRLHGDLKDHFSFRIGKLRIIYTVVEKEKIVYIIAIGPRKTIYE
jgi:mRNA-degrading endonuclease RelE of RelBE toxin-antitoxin system